MDACSGRASYPKTNVVIDCIYIYIYIYMNVRHHPLTSFPWHTNFRCGVLLALRMCAIQSHVRHTQIMRTWITSRLVHCIRRPFSVFRRYATTCFVSCVLSYVEKQPALSYKNLPRPRTLSVCRSVSLSIFPFYLSENYPVYLASICLCVYLSICRSVYVCV